MRSNPYPSDLTDEQWADLESWIQPEKPNCRPRKHSMREMIKAIRKLVREDCT